MIKAIDTLYNGNYFRSRLEARWAVFFDAIGVRWEYEAEGYDLGEGLRYLPDFWFPDHKMYGEVKATEVLSDTEFSKIKALAIQSGHPVILFDGIPRAMTMKIFEWRNDRWEWEVSEEGEGEGWRVLPFAEVLTGRRKYFPYMYDVTSGFPVEYEGDQMYSKWMDAIHAAQTKRFEHGSR